MISITGDFGVDAGNISIADLAYIRLKGGDYSKTARRLCKKISLEPGTYQVTAIIYNTWNFEESISDDIEGEEEEKKRYLSKSFLLETTGEVVIGDICYLFSSEESSSEYWPMFLDITDYLEKSNLNCYFISTGGDGEFPSEVSFEKVS